LVEQATVNRWVRGSSPREAAIILIKKEKPMATTKELSEETKNIRTRINQLVDEIHMLKSELQQFKNNVASDVKYLTDRVDGGR
jgi:predicted RNase H-like nuclease (RuvC/YqgF family)